MSKALIIAALFSLVASAIVGILIFSFGEFNENQQHLLLTTVALGGFSLIGLAHAVHRPVWWLWPLRPLGMAAAVVALGLAIPLIWNLVQDTELIWKSFVTLSVLAFTSAQISLLGAFDARNNVVWVWRFTAILIAASVAYLIIYSVLGHIHDARREFFLRGMGVAVILDVLGTVGLYPLSRLGGKIRGSAFNQPSPNKPSPPKRKPDSRRPSLSR